MSKTSLENTVNNKSMSQAPENLPVTLSLDKAVERQPPKDIDNQASSIGIDKIRGNLATRLINLIIWVNIGIGILVAGDLIASKWLVSKTIEYVATQTAQVAKSGDNTLTPKAAEIAVVYKDLLKESALNKDLLTLLLTSQTALVSGALGFYFGGKDNSK
ncbi:MAG: hypothetical protein WCO45_13550 [Pseudanabaena sp. ELA607]